MGWDDLREFVTDPDVIKTADKFITTPQEAQQMEYEQKKADLELRMLEEQLKQQIKNQQPSNADYVEGETPNNTGGSSTGSDLFQDKYLLLGGGLILATLVIANK